MPMSAKGFKYIMSWNCLNSPMSYPLLLQRFTEVNLLKRRRVDENTGYSEIMLFHPIPTFHLFSASREQNPMDGGKGLISQLIRAREMSQEQYYPRSPFSQAPLGEWFSALAGWVRYPAFGTPCSLLPPLLLHSLTHSFFLYIHWVS